MPSSYTRQGLYALMWAKPKKEVATDLGISDYHLLKACREHSIPIPEVGYWQRKAAGKPTFQRPLPPRQPGHADEIDLPGTSRPEFDPLTDPIPPAPVFPEELAQVEARIRKTLGKLTCPPLPAHPHKEIAKLLARDQERLAEFHRTGYDWRRPKLDNPLRQRWLRLLNALFIGLQRFGARPWLSNSEYADRDREEIRVSHVGKQYLSFTLGPITPHYGKDAEKPSGPLRLKMETRRQRGTKERQYLVWEDQGNAKLEGLVDEIVVAMILEAEIRYRNGALGHHEWLIEYKAREIEAEKQRIIEVERQAIARKKQEERDRLARLFSQARSLHQAETIRSYIEAVKLRSVELTSEPAAVQRWIDWAESEARRIDPVLNGTIDKAIGELE
ncbi:hypothetical protein [Ferrovibrio xuzhouensis]|uniref:Uncharacterized protein n=1 Tax=Ferrovibrio xuzhouensis TaxID=1576914 RepID=A0ABV7VAD6_9PROT